MKTPAQSRLDRKLVVPRLLGDTDEFLIVSGLAGAAKDVAALTREGANTFLMGGAMGSSVPFAMGLAYAQRERRVLVVTGDGELMMSLGALATVGVMQPGNLAIVCVDNGHYGETGYQAGHTSRGVDLAAIARGAGIVHCRTVSRDTDIVESTELLHSQHGPVFVWLQVSTEPPPAYKRSFDAVECKARFKRALLERT